MKLYDLTNAIQQVWDLVFDEEMDLETLEDTLQSLEAGIEEKAEGYAHIIKQAEFEADFIRNEEKRLAEKRRALENKAERLKQNLQFAIEASGKSKLKTERYSINVQNNPPSVEVEDETIIPDVFLIPQPPKVDKKAILQHLKDGYLIKGCSIKQGRSLRIK